MNAYIKKNYYKNFYIVYINYCHNPIILSKFLDELKNNAKEVAKNKNKKWNSNCFNHNTSNSKWEKRNIFL